MISCQSLYEIFKRNNLTFFTGVPDSTFKDWMKFLADEHGNKLTNIIACNECEATAIATGYHLSTKKTAVVYMQNSGLGKAVNPLTSLCDPEVYSIPLLLLIGWRGEPGKKDEPQHKKMGRIMIPLLDTLELPYTLLPDTPKEAESVIEKSRQLAEEKNSPVALIIKKRTLEEYQPKKTIKTNSELNREQAIKVIIDNLTNSDIVVSTTGKTSRELFEYRIEKKENPRDFYTVGSMGCSASIAHSIALQKKDRKVFIFDGDGSVLMQMGALATIGNYNAANLYHIIFDNASHESTGGQPTVSPSVDFEKIAKACGYEEAKTVHDVENLKKELLNIQSSPGPYMLIVKVNIGSRKDLGRSTTTPIQNKEAFMDFLSS